jgi:CubicO group peptidase (beta-lactamase class C family)
VNFPPQAGPTASALLFEPGEGWDYGTSVNWTALLVSRLTGKTMTEWVQEHTFDPLGMKSSTYYPAKHPELCDRLLKMVQRNREGKLKAVEQEVRGLISSVPDILTLLADLMSPSSKILSQENQNLLFTPQLTHLSASLLSLRKDTENYAAPAGIPQDTKDPPVNHSLAALLVEGELPISHMPIGTLTWNGMPNVIWAVNRNLGLAAMFATQLLPVDDEQAVELAMEFFKTAWNWD